MNTDNEKIIKFSPAKKTFHFEEIENAFVNGDISINAFAQILSDNFGRKKARKILRNNLDLKLKEEGMTFEERQQYLLVISLLV